MSHVWIRKGVAISVVLPIAALIAGCPIPLPSGYTTSSRENVGAEVAGRLVAGISTREEVLLLLGEPDGAGPDDSWLAYGSAYVRGGVVFVMCAGGGCGGAGGEKMEYRRLIVTFDEHGLMTNAEFVSQECWEGFIAVSSAGDRSPPCIQVNAPSGEQKTTADDNQETFHRGEAILIPRDLLDFANGKAELITPGWVTGFGAALAAGNNIQLTKGLHDSGQWEALARIIIHDNYGDNLRWYYLGRAAEGMGLCDAAILYYGISKEQSESFVTRCLGPVCAGIKLPDALETRFSAIEAMRSTGKCSTPPVT